MIFRQFNRNNIKVQSKALKRDYFSKMLSSELVIGCYFRYLWPSHSSAAINAR